jgi:flagellar biogenesis protein FliO
MITFINILMAIEVIMVWVIFIAILGLILLCIWKLAKIVLKWVKNKKNGGNNETN